MPKCDKSDLKVQSCDEKQQLSSMLRTLAFLLLAIISASAALVLNAFTDGAPPALVVEYAVLSLLLVSFFRRARPKLDIPRTSPLSVCDIAISILVLIGIIFATYLGIAALSNICSDLGGEQYEQNIDAMGTVVSIIAACLFAPLVEEVLFRGILFGALCRRLPIIVSALVSSVLFAALHGTLFHLIGGTLLGMYLCALYMRCGKLWLCVLAHAIYNALTFLPLEWTYVILIAGVGVCGLVVLASWFAAAGNKMSGSETSIGASDTPLSSPDRDDILLIEATSPRAPEDASESRG